ncbi:hypothetical protein, partial [Klebsiella pneumoniae]|uniref:hypothetical protein n=1 Tax=Klebsiella pneumoniae TaxID=573 RepID=UPI001C6F2989
LKMPAFEWVHVQLHQQKGMISLSPPTICNSASEAALIPGGDMNRVCLCILVLTLFGYPVGSQSGWSIYVSHINVNISL